MKYQPFIGVLSNHNSEIIQNKNSLTKFTLLTISLRCKLIISYNQNFIIEILHLILDNVQYIPSLISFLLQYIQSFNMETKDKVEADIALLISDLLSYSSLNHYILGKHKTKVHYDSYLLQKQEKLQNRVLNYLFPILKKFNNIIVKLIQYIEGKEKVQFLKLKLLVFNSHLNKSHSIKEVDIFLYLLRNFN